MVNNNPENRFGRGGCCVSVFVNEVRMDGRLVPIKEAVFQKRYRDKGGEWQSTSSLDVNDVPKAILCLMEAYEWMTRPELAVEEEVVK